MEKLCYNEPKSCYSCINADEDGEMLSCSKNCKVQFQLLFALEDNEDEMKVQYKRAVMRAKNCRSYIHRYLVPAETIDANNCLCL
jgi:hypothetical protein